MIVLANIKIVWVQRTTGTQEKLHQAEWHGQCSTGGLRLHCTGGVNGSGAVRMGGSQPDRDGPHRRGVDNPIRGVRVFSAWKCHRGSTEQGFVYLGDHKIPITHPRVRTRNGAEELPLATYHAFQYATQTTQTVRERMLFELVSQQQIPADAALESAVETAGPSKSTVSRRFIQAMQQALDQFLRRRIDDQTWVVLMIDGIRVGGHLVVVALGIDATGHKRILGMSEGTTENSTVVKHLLTDLVDRGLSFPGGELAVIDGTKALAKGLHEVFGPVLRIQRCQIHKQRNVLDEVAESAKHSVQLKLRRAYQEPETPKTLASLEKLAQELAHDYPPAAASLREGLAKTLTVHQLGLSGTLRQSLANTNV